MTNRRLIKNACVISVDPEIGTLPRADILITDDRITAVSAGISAEDAEVIDGQGMIAMPGLICCHRHLWMTLLRGYVSDGTWSSYYVETFWGRRPLYRARDNHSAAYAGALEAIDAGVTTVLDFHDCSVAPGNADASLDALEKSGIRAVFSYGLEGAPNLANGQTPALEDLSPTEDWHRSEAQTLRSGRLSSDDDLVTMGITTRNIEKLPHHCSEHDLGLARELGVRTTTTHAGGGAQSLIRTLIRKCALPLRASLWRPTSALDQAESSRWCATIPETCPTSRFGCANAWENWWLSESRNCQRSRAWC